MLFASGAMLGGAAPPAGAVPPIGAAPAPPPRPPPPPPVVQLPCVNPRDTADYVPGVDAYGRPVAPADLPGGADVQISTEVYPILKSRNRQLDGVGVVANLPGLANRPICPPAPPPGRAPPRR